MYNDRKVAVCLIGSQSVTNEMTGNYGNEVRIIKCSKMNTKGIGSMILIDLVVSAGGD